MGSPQSPISRTNTDLEPANSINPLHCHCCSSVGWQFIGYSVSYVADLPMTCNDLVTGRLAQEGATLEQLQPKYLEGQQLCLDSCAAPCYKLVAMASEAVWHAINYAGLRRL